MGGKNAKPNFHGWLESDDYVALFVDGSHSLGITKINTQYYDALYEQQYNEYSPVVEIRGFTTVDTWCTPTLIINGGFSKIDEEFTAAPGVEVRGGTVVSSNGIGGYVTVIGGYGKGSGHAGVINIIGGQQGSVSGSRAGRITILGGTSVTTGSHGLEGGHVTVAGGNGPLPGDVTVRGGVQSLSQGGPGGAVLVTGGQGSNKDAGGYVNVSGGSSTVSSGGPAYLIGGGTTATSNIAGHVYIAGGSSGNGGRSGYIQLASPAVTSGFPGPVFATPGTLMRFSVETTGIRFTESCITSLSTAGGPMTMTGSLSGIHFNNNGSASMIFYTLAGSAGWNYGATVVSTQGIRFTAPVNHTIVDATISPTVISTVGSGYIESTQYGAHVWLTCVRSGLYVVTKKTGVWSIV